MNEDQRNQIASDYVIEHLEKHRDIHLVAEYVDGRADDVYSSADLFNFADYGDIQSLIHQKLRELMKYV